MATQNWHESLFRAVVFAMKISYPVLWLNGHFSNEEYMKSHWPGLQRTMKLVKYKYSAAPYLQVIFLLYSISLIWPCAGAWILVKELNLTLTDFSCLYCHHVIHGGSQAARGRSLHPALLTGLIKLRRYLFKCTPFGYVNLCDIRVWITLRMCYFRIGSFPPVSAVEGIKSVLSVHLCVCASVCLSVSALTAEPFDIHDMTAWRLDILWCLLGKNTGKEGTSREGASTLRRFHWLI